jgi:hypothetical protein
MVLALILFLVILLLVQVLLLILIKNMSMDLMHLQGDMNQVRRTFVPPPNVGGRPVPSSADIAAARARAPMSMTPPGPNQVDSMGTAQIGGSPPKT